MREPYTKEQKDFLIKYASELEPKDLVPAFNNKFHCNRTRQGLYDYMCRNNIDRKFSPNRRGAKFTLEQEAWLYEHGSIMKLSDLVKVFNELYNLDVTAKQIHSWRHNHGVEGYQKYHRYTEEEKQWLKDNINECTYDELSKLFNAKFNTNISGNALKCCAGVLDINGTHNPFTPEQDEWLRKNALNYKNYDEVAKDFNKKFGTNKQGRGIQGHCARYLKIISGRQAKVPHGWNSKPIGAELLTSEGYILIKISDTKIRNKDWITKQRYIYQQYHGKDSLKESDVVIFLDGDKNNYSIDNLRAIPRKVSLRMNSNSWSPHDKDFTNAAIAWCELYYALREVKE